MLKNSLFLKLISIFAIFVLVFVIALSWINISTAESIFKKNEEQKLQLLIDSYLPKLATKLSIESQLALEGIGKKLILLNPNIKMLTIKNSATNKTYSLTNENISDLVKYESYSYGAPIFSPATTKRIGELKINYINKNTKSIFEEHASLIVGSVLLYIALVIILLSTTIYFFKPLKNLINTIKNLDSNMPELNIQAPNGGDEISQIRSAIFLMTKRIQKNSEKQKMLTNELEKSSKHLEEMQKIADIGSWEYNIAEKRLYASQQLRELFGIKSRKKRLFPTEFINLIPNKERQEIKNGLSNLLKKGSPFELEHRIVTKSGKERHVRTLVHMETDANSEQIIIGTSLNITEKTNNRMMVEHMEYHDSLTNLPNYLLLNDRLKQNILEAQRNSQQVAVLFFDLDNFKLINDSMGHTIGDKLIQTVAQALQESLRKVDTIARIGGDEFIIVLPMIESIENVKNKAEQIIDLMRQKWEVEQHMFHTTASIGISIFPDNAEDGENLIKYADIAMYKAKDSGRNNIQFFNKSMSAQSNQRHTIEQDLRVELENPGSQLRLFYQPKIHVATGAVVGAEALVRWQHPKWGLLMPLSFIEQAENSGLIIDMGEWIINQACDHIKKLEDLGHKISVSVNLSGRQFQHRNLFKTVENAIESSGINPENLEFEITETVSMSHTEDTTRILDNIKMLGVKISVDDFGTGYSSLAYLKIFPIDTLKIDHSFIRNIANDPDDLNIAETIIKMGHTMGMSIVAEGVEEKVQVDLLRELGCDIIQGFFYEKPVPFNNFLEFVATKKE